MPNLPGTREKIVLQPQITGNSIKRKPNMKARTSVAHSRR